MCGRPQIHKPRTFIVFRIGMDAGIITFGLIVRNASVSAVCIGLTFGIVI